MHRSGPECKHVACIRYLHVSDQLGPVCCCVRSQKLKVEVLLGGGGCSDSSKLFIDPTFSYAGQHVQLRKLFLSVLHFISLHRNMHLLMDEGRANEAN